MKVGWRIDEWREEAGGFSRAHVYRLIERREVETVKSGHARIILTPPREYLKRLLEEQQEL